MVARHAATGVHLHPVDADVEVTTAERQDCIGAAQGPEYAGLFVAMGDDRLAAGFDRTRAARHTASGCTSAVSLHAHFHSAGK